MLLEKHIDVPIRIRGTYNAATKYNVGDAVRFVISGVSKGWLLMVDAPAGTAPRANSAYWVEFTAALAETRGAQGLPAPAPQVRYSDDGNAFRPNYVDGDLFREVSYDGGSTWTRERIRGDRGIQGIPGVGTDGIDGTNAPLVIWQYAADPPDDVTPIEWRDNYVAGDVWKHWSNDDGSTWGPPERILGRDGRDGFDLERQYSDSHDGPWEARDTGQEWVRERVGNVDPFGVPYRRSGDTHATSGITESRARQIATEIANARAEARYTDPEKGKLANVEDRATRDQSPEEIRDALVSLGIDLNNEVVDMHDGLRDATVADFGKLGIGPDGILYRVKREANPGHDAEGMFNEYMHAMFRGVAHGRPNNPQVGEIYYNIRIHQWYLFFQNRVVVMIDAQPITPVQALGANTEWIGEVDDVYQARHAIQNFDNTKAYYAVYGEKLYVLDNTTYSAATTETTYTYKWIPILADEIIPFTGSIELGQFENATVGAISGHYSRDGADTRLDISYTNATGADISASIRNVKDGYGFQFSNGKIFVVETQNDQSTWREFHGFWVNEDVDDTAEGAVVSMSVIPHELRMIRFMTAEQIEAKLEVIGRLKDLTSDIHVDANVGDFVDVTNAEVAGITHVPTSIQPEDIDFGNLTYGNPSTLAPYNSPVYTVVRIAKSLGRIETQFRAYNELSKTSEQMNLLRGEDEDWYYYLPGVTRAGLVAGVVIRLQRRATHTHTSFNGRLGETPLAQINAQLPNIGGGSTTPSANTGILAYESIPNATAIPVRQLVTYQNGYYGSLIAHTKETGDNPAADTARWRLLSSVIGPWVAGNYPIGTIAKFGDDQWIANETIFSTDPAPTHENNTKWKQLTSHEGLTALITRIDDAFGEISDNRDRLAADETKLENFIQTVNNYFNGQGEGDITAQEIAHLFALLDEYNPVIDDIRSTLGLVSELGEPTRLIEDYADQTTFLSNANVPATLPKIEYIAQYINNAGEDAVLFSTGEKVADNVSVYFNYTTLNHVATSGGGGIIDPFLRYYLNGDTDDADAIQSCALIIADNRVYILLDKHTGGGSDPLAAFTNATLRPYISYAPLDNLASDGTITKQSVETLAPTNADHDVSFIPSFQEELPNRRISLRAQDARGWYFNNTDSGTTFNSILAKWYADFQWISRMYEYFRLAVERVEQGSGGDDPREKQWIDGSKNPLDPANSVVRPPYPSLEALKTAFPIPDLTFYFKLSVDGMVMNLADHDIHRPKRNKLVQIPDTHYNTPPRVTFLPTIGRENELFQLVSDQYRPDSDHTWTFQPERRTVNNRTVAGASMPTTLGGIHQKIGETSDSQDALPAIFQRSAISAIVAFADDPEHLHLYINPQRATTTDVLTVEIHGLRSDRSPIVRTATFRYAETFSISSDSIRRFQSRVSGAYGIMDLSETISISIKRGNTYLYLNPANTPPSPEWETGLLYTAGLYKGKADGTFARAVILEEDEFPNVERIEDEIEALQQITENIPISADVLWATSKVLATTETTAIVDTDWTLTNDVPDGVVLNTAGASDIIDIPKTIRGEIHVDIVDGDDALIQRLAVDLHIGIFTIRDFLTNANKLRIAVSESGTDDTKLSVWLDNVSSVTFPANTRVKIYGVVALARADISGIETRIATAETELAALKAQVSNIPVSRDVLWLTSPVLNTRGGVSNRFGNNAWTVGDDAPAGISGFSNMVNLPSSIRGDLHFEYFQGEVLQGRAIVPIHTTETGTRIRLGNLADITVSVRTSATITITLANIIPSANSTIRVYGVTALPVSEVAGVTEAQLLAALRPFDADIFPKLAALTSQGLTRTFVLEFGSLPPEIKRANRLIVNFQGVVVYNALPAGGFVDGMVLPIPITSQNAESIVRNVGARDTLYDCDLKFRLNNEATDLATRRVQVVIDRS